MENKNTFVPEGERAKLLTMKELAVLVKETKGDFLVQIAFEEGSAADGNTKRRI